MTQASVTHTQTRLTLRELWPSNGLESDSCLIEISVARRSETITFKLPFGDEEERELSWFLEFYPQSPFSVARAEGAARKLDRYARDVASQLFSSPLFKSCVATDGPQSTLEVSIEPLTNTTSLTRFNQVHWEVLESRETWAALQISFAAITVVRRVKCISNTESDPRASASPPNGNFRILFVCARRSLDNEVDISSRLIMQPVFEIIDQAKAKGRVGETQILRNATWEEFKRTLQSKPKGWFDEVHFDCHGEVIGGKAYLLFATDSSSGSRKKLASSIAEVLVESGISLANLNACSTALASSRNVDESLAITFAKAGIPITIAMSYDILDAASCRFEEEFYRSWLLGADQDIKPRHSLLDRLRNRPATSSSAPPRSLKGSVCQAACNGRAALRERGERAGRGGWQVYLRDDIVPVVYLSDRVSDIDKVPAMPELQPSKTPKPKWGADLRAALPAIASSCSPSRPAATGSSMPRKVEATVVVPKDRLLYSSLSPPGFRFKQFDPAIIGRDSAVVQLEQKMSRPGQNVCVIQGVGGSGKSLFSRHLCDWWTTSSFVKDFFYVDLHKIAMIKSAQLDHDHTWCAYNKDSWVHKGLIFMFDSIWPSKTSRKSHRDQARLTKSQWDALIKEIRSGRYLIVFDNADFPLREDDDSMAATEVMMTGSGIKCRDSCMASCASLMTLSLFLSEVEGGQSKIIVTTRYKKWMIDRYCGSNRFYFTLPQLPLSEALSIAQRKLDSPEADTLKYEYAGVKEDLSAIIDLLQLNPLAIELVMAHMVQKNLSPKEIHLKICTDGLDLNESDASLAFAGGGRFVSELQTMCSIDWTEDCDESRLPCSMFWISSILGYLPETEHYSFWFAIVGFLLLSWEGDLTKLGLDLDRSATEVSVLLAQQVTSQSHYDETVKALGLAVGVDALCNTMEEVGVMETEETTDQDTGEVKSLHKIHPLFTLTARDGTWGWDDEDHFEKMCQSRRSIAGQYVVTRYQVLYTERILGGSAGLQTYRNGLIPLQTTETRSATLQFLQSALKDLPALIDALLWAASTPATGKQITWWKGAPDLLRAAIFLASSFAEMKKETLYVTSEALNALYERCRLLLHEESFARDSKFVGLTVRLAFVLATMSSGRDGLPAPLVYLKQERDLLSKHRSRFDVQEKFPLDLEIMLKQVDTLEANFYFLAGDHETALQLQKKILKSQQPCRIPEQMRKTYLVPVIFQWLIQLKVRNESFPTIHQLLQLKQPIKDIVSKANLWDSSEAATFNRDVQPLLQKSVHDLVSTTTPLPVPPPNKRFDSQFLQLFGGSAGEGVVNGLGTVHPSRTIKESTETTLLKKFLLLSDVTGSSGLAAVHMRAASMLIGSGQWIEGLRHLKSYASLPMPQEDRMRPELRCQNSLLAMLCLAKLRCFALARAHAFRALEEAVRAHDDGQSLILSLGALAGLEAGRTNAPTLYAKLLLLLALRTIYSPQQPHRSSSTAGPSRYQLNCRNGYRLRLMTMLGSLAPKYGGSYHPAFRSRMLENRMRERVERGEISVEGFEIPEAAFDATVLMVQLDIARAMEKHGTSRAFGVDRALENKIYAEAEMCLVGLGPVDRKKLVYLADSPWIELYPSYRSDLTRLLPLLFEDPDPEPDPDLNPDLTLNPAPLDLDELFGALDIRRGPPSFDPPPAALAAYRARKSAAAAAADDDDDEDSDSEPDPDDDDVDADGYSRHKMFWDHATDHLVAPELVRGVFDGKVWEQVEGELAGIKRDLEKQGV